MPKPTCYECCKRLLRNRIVKQFGELQHGDSWISNSFKEVLHGVDFKKATENISGNTNNIWQLVAHITYWRTLVVNRLTGSDNPPPFPDFHLPDEPAEESWRQALHDFEGAYHLLRNAVHHFNENNLDKPSPRKEQTYYELILGCLQHDAYHLGQMMLLKKGFSMIITLGIYKLRRLPGAFKIVRRILRGRIISSLSFNFGNRLQKLCAATLATLRSTLNL